MECERLVACPFFKVDESDPTLASAKRGLAAMYCRGDKMEKCVRLAISHEFGGPLVPQNMMPNGMPLPGTTEAKWDTKVIKFKRDLLLL
jgi:hypothetical protein